MRPTKRSPCSCSCSTRLLAPPPVTFTSGREALPVRSFSTFQFRPGTGDLPLSFRLGPAPFVARPEIGINTIRDAIQAIVGGGAYVNIHASQFTAGEIRVQLTRLP
jgi:hypothetical protein